MSADAPPRPLPIPDLETQPFWDAAGRGVLAVQRCCACGEHRLYPKALCPSCHADAHDWVEVSGRGRVYSFSVVRRAPSPAFAARVPYVVAIIALAEGPHLLSHVVGIEPDAVRIGLEVRVEFEEAGEGVRLPVFRRV
jgi:uncharacterized OB-fold protein